MIYKFKNRYIVYADNKILCKKGFRSTDKLNNSEIKVFLTRCSARSYLKDIYNLKEEEYQIVKVDVFIKEELK